MSSGSDAAATSDFPRRDEVSATIEMKFGFRRALQGGVMEEFYRALRACDLAEHADPCTRRGCSISPNDKILRADLHWAGAFIPPPRATPSTALFSGSGKT